MKKIFFIITLFTTYSVAAQELYIYTEPASNMPAKSISTKLTGNYGQRRFNSVQHRYTPELMFGINKNWMVHVATTFSNMHQKNIGWESVYTYAKYRFLSKDDVHKHFRMAAFAEAAYSKNDAVYDELMLQGDMSGIQGGIIATQLVNKLAVSATTSYVQYIETENSPHHSNPFDKAMNYTLSAGYLVLPREYKSYDQLNFNIYTELLVQRIFDSKRYYIDIAPALQFIIKSNSKINLGYRKQLKGNMYRGFTESFLVSFEHTFFNALRKKKH
jgi:hypothetical protein